MTELNVRDLLDTAAAEPPPATQVDIGRAIKTGRGRVTRRRRLAIGGVALTVCLVLGGSASLFALDRKPAPEPAATPSPPATFDILVPYAAFGWLPAGVPDREVASIPSQLRLEATDLAKPEKSRPNVTLRVAPARLDAPDDDLADAAPVGGRPALGGGNDIYAVLRWEYARGAWAEVQVSGVPATGAVARKVAENVRFGSAERLRLPFVPPRTVHGQPLMYVSLTRGRADWQGRLTWGEASFSPRAPLSMSFWPVNGQLGGGNTTIDGRRALHKDQPADRQLLMMEEPGWLSLRMTTGDKTTVPPGGLVDLYRSLTITPDPAKWE